MHENCAYKGKNLGEFHPKHLRTLQSLGGLIHVENEKNGQIERIDLVNTPSGSMAARMGLEPGFLVLEYGYGDDCDEGLRQEIIGVCGNNFESEDSKEVVDAVILWWRDGDSDLVDALVDVLAYLTEHGPIWVLTPKAGRPNHVEPSDIQDAAPTAGLSQTSSFPVAADWSGTKLVARKSSKR